MRIGALEAGGTKMVCAVGDENGRLYDRITIPTAAPEKTMPAVISYFRQRSIEALGVASFGPVDVRTSSDTYGYILDTPKTEWKFFDLRGELSRELRVPIALDTDVNGSCLGEMTYGCAKGLQSVVYITVGTGIGVGIGIHGRLLHGMLHPEGGHMLLRRHPDDPARGFCPFHENCLEGLASGPALEKRWGKRAEELSEDAGVWELESFYLAQALTNLVFLLSPQKIILGGGVMRQEQLFSLIRRKVKEMVGDYIVTPELQDMETYIVPASLRDDQGILGCIRLGRDEIWKK